MSFFGIGGNSDFFNQGYGSSGIFGSSSTSNSSFSLGDWSMIKGGSYKKLLKAYYKTEKDNSETDETSETTDKKGVSSASKQNMTVAGDAGNLTSKADKLSELVKKYSAEFEDASDERKTAMKDDLYKAASEYVKAYNSVIDSASESDNNSVLRNALSITKNTKANKKMLDKMGISIDSNNKLSIDEKKFKESDMTMSNLKTMFTGQSSYVSHIKRSTSIINNAAAAAVVNEKRASSYTHTGAYSSMIGSISYYNNKI
ncbi:MAG: hypothetical protein HFH14_06890 [Lachnospiraceae bacterium]|nr:hypothetical protein [Lachnospiraceae bacterium]